jgi:hypothetical protein
MKDLAMILGTAALTALIAALLLAPEATVAEDERGIELFVDDGAKLEVDGLTLTVDGGGKVREAGEKPVITLKVVSSAKKTVCVEVDVEVTSMDQMELFSRAMSIPEKVWSQRVEAKVAPGATREIELAPDFTTSAGEVVNINLCVGKQKVYAAGFVVKAPETEAESPAAEPAVAKTKP